MINYSVLVIMMLLSFPVYSSVCEPPAHNLEHKIFKIVPRNPYMPMVSVADARARFNKECILKEKSITAQLNCRVLESCSGADCQPNYMPYGSAFFIAGYPWLFTAWHVVNSTHAAALLFAQPYLTKLTAAERTSKLSGIKPDFVLVNHKDEVIYDTADDLKRASYAFWGEPLSTIFVEQGKKADAVFGFVESAPDDYVAVFIEPGNFTAESMGVPVSVLTTKAGLQGKCMYAAGYPYSEPGFTLSGGQLAHIRDLQLSYTFATPFTVSPLKISALELLAMETEDILQAMGYSEQSIVQTMQTYDQPTIQNAIEVTLKVQRRNMQDQFLAQNENIIFYSGGVSPGQSGGPILDKQGHVIGIATNGFFEQNAATGGKLVSYGGAGLLLSALKLGTR